jgi:hypothetical protein
MRPWAFAASQGNFRTECLHAGHRLQSHPVYPPSRRLSWIPSAATAYRHPNPIWPESTNLHQSLILVTGLVPVVGYDKACLIAKKAAKEGLTLKEAALQSGWVTAEQFDAHMDPAKLAGVK